MGNRDPFTVVLAGSALFILYARGRVGDVSKCAIEPFLDISPDNTHGFVQSALLDHKTAKPGSKLALPLVAPAFGVSGQNWAAPWLAARRDQGLDASRIGTLLQAPAVDMTWTAVPMATLEFGAALRELLLRGGFAPEQLGNIGAHSLKATTLSWLAKRGVDKDTRRTLGYHVKADERSMEAYSRDSLAGPLRTLSSVINEIRVGRFVPDTTRSGQVAQPDQPKAASSSSSSAAPRSLSPIASSQAPSSGAEEPQGDVVVEDSFIRNETTKRFHIPREDGKLACDRELPVRRSYCDTLPWDARLCSRCF